jgi:hypothetical protein
VARLFIVAVLAHEPTYHFLATISRKPLEKALDQTLFCRIGCIGSEQFGERNVEGGSDPA